MRAGVGFTLQPDPEFLELCGPLIRDDADYYEVVPETTWREQGGQLVPNGFHRAWVELRHRSGKPFVAHGVGLSLASSGRAEAARRRRWLARMRADQRAFRYRWYTEHLGATSFAGQSLTLPMPVPMTPYTARRVRAQLAAMAQVVLQVGVENTAVYHAVGDPLAEPAWIARILGARHHLLLDLHNLHTAAVNLGYDPVEYLNRLDMSRVIEIHVSGGCDSDPAWGPVKRLDSHDAAVPDAVWRLLERVVGRCANLRGVTLERMEGTVTPADVPLLRAEMARIRRLLA